MKNQLQSRRWCVVPYGRETYDSGLEEAFF